MNRRSVKYHNGVLIHGNGHFYAYCSYYNGTGMDGKQECAQCESVGEGYRFSIHPDAFPADLERDYAADMSMDDEAATEWYDTTDGIG